MVSDSKLGVPGARRGFRQHDQAVVVALGVDFHAGVVAGDGLVFLGIALVELHGGKRGFKRQKKHHCSVLSGLKG
jgi:hypothetical protein